MPLSVIKARSTLGDLIFIEDCGIFLYSQRVALIDTHRLCGTFFAVLGKKSAQTARTSTEPEG